MFDEGQFLERARLDHATLEIWIREEWLVPARSGVAPEYSEMDVARARLIHDLRGNMGVNDEGLGLILHLLDQMHGLRKALAEALVTLHGAETRKLP
jgi:chaperone modulatory protein CbpM